VKWTAIIVCLVVAACSRTPPPSSSAPPNILLITIDTLRADRVGRGLTSSIDAVAARATRFTNARATVPLTLPSHVSIMTGELPLQSGVRVNGGGGLASGHPTIARVLKDGGYRTGAFVGAYVLDKRFGLADGFDLYDDRVPRDPSGAASLEAERRADAVVNAALAWLPSSDPRPFFAWIHLYDPHAPYDPPADYLARAKNVPYDGEVAFADAQLGRVLEWLTSSGQASRTVIAIAGDHGEGLGDHGELTHGMLAYDSTLRVPLVVAIPGAAAATVSEAVSLVDLAGTLAELAHRPRPSTMHAQSLIRTPIGERDTYAETDYPRAAGWHSLRVLVADRWKLIVSSEPELYDLRLDPGETRNVASERSNGLAGLRARLREIESAPGTASSSASGSVPSDVAERLRALGYVSGGSAGGVSDDRAPNPARHIAAWNAFERELSRLTAGDARRALPGLVGLARAFPDSPLFQSTYARALKDTGRVTEAFDLYKRLVARWPGNADLYHDLAVAAGAAGLPKEAARAEQAALALEPSNAAAANGLGLLRIENGRPSDAAAAFEEAVKLDPSNATFWTNLGNARRAEGNATAAEHAYLKALELNPRHADAANGIGVLLVQAHRSGEAIPFFERALAGSPRFAEARLNLGIAYQESGNAEKAAEQFRRVLELAPPGSREYQAAAALLARQ
jgi:arylsulfatase A-like enzyme/Flp pilus assembly protein TadD